MERLSINDVTNAVTVAELPPLEGSPATRRDSATQQLVTLLDLYDRGMREPAPIACRASAAYATARVKGKDPAKAGRSAWESSHKFDSEDKEEEHRLVWGGDSDFDAFLEESPRADEAGEEWDQDETSRFGRYAMRLWTGLLAHEVIEDR